MKRKRLTRNVYTMIERNTGTYYGVHPSVKDVDRHMNDIIECRQNSAARYGGEIDAQINRLALSEDNDLLLSAEIRTPEAGGEIRSESFRVYRGRI